MAKRFIFRVLIISIFVFDVAVLLWGCDIKMNKDTLPQHDEAVSAFSQTEIFEISESAKEEVFRRNNLTDREVVLRIEPKTKDGILIFEGRASSQKMKAEYIESFLRLLDKSSIEFEDRVYILPDNDLEDKIFAVVKYPVVNLGSGPFRAEGADVVTQAKMGDILKVLEGENGWYFVQMEDNYLGWIDGKFIWRCSKNALDSYLKNRFVLVKAKMAEAFDEGLNPVFDKKLVQGTVIPYISEEGEYIAAVIPGAGKAFVAKEYCAVLDSREEAFIEKKDAESIIATAKQYLGLPYLWGGTTAYGFDCSGLTQFAFRVNGYFLRRDADMQFCQGIEVKDKKELKAGDLVFFQTYKEGPSHVGIFIGDDRFIHAGSKSGIAINSFNPEDPDYSEYLDKRYIGARRVIP
jgi:hypothetical protein